MSEYIHLHNHTHYSLLDAIATPQELIDAAVVDGQDAMALTDHGVMFGTMEFYDIAVKKGIKPIIGFEAYVAEGSRFDRIAGKSKEKKKRNYYHLVLLAKDMTGYQNLVKLTSLGHTEGFYYKPRVDRELLEKYCEGVVALSACIVGVVNAHIVNDDLAAAYEAAKFYQDLYGDDFYIELQNHKLPDDEKILTEAPIIAKELGIKTVATNDIHYVDKDHATAHNLFLYIRDVTAATAGKADIYKLRYRTPEMYFKTQREMKELFSDFPDAIKNTVEIADKCNLKFDHKLYMPEFPIPKESKSTNLEEYLEELTWIGIEDKFDEATPEIKERVEHELGIINGMGFPGYFLIVWDFVKAARELGVMVGPGRGSAAGSIVAYALGITNVNPMPYHLLFERFLNPDRVSMPDIDIDFCDDKRERVIDYVKQKYGEGSVAQIITFGKLSSRAVITDVGRVLGVPLTTVREITSKIPVVRGKVTPLKDAIEMPDLKWVKKTDDPKIKELIQFSIILEGKIRNASTHAAGVVIAPGEVTNYVPVYQAPKSKAQGADVATQYSMNELEEAGLLKMDFLGLRTLSIIENTVQMANRNFDINIDIDQIDFEDEKTYDLLGDGKTLAVFQFESGGMQDYLRKLKPRNLEEITAMNALYRPGPMENIPEFINRKFGRSEITYLHPIMEKSLKNTYGIIVYQEQVMQLVQHIAGFSLGQADILRRAMGKKKIKLMDAQKPLFIEGAKKHGISKDLAMEIFNLIVKFASYGFNKSHSLAYSYLAYQTAWLKAHYPAEFLAANMSAELNSQQKIVQLIDEAKNFGIKVLPPDVNRSLATFNAVGNEIYFGMAGIRNVGVNAVESIVRARQESPFVSLFDFISRVDTRLINKRALEALICSGAFDSLNAGHRASLIASIDSAFEYARAYQNNQSSNMDSLFGGEGAELKEPDLEIAEEWTEKQRLEKEKEFLNFYISGHPLSQYRAHMTLATLDLGNKENPLLGTDAEVQVCGLIAELNVKLNKKNQSFAIIKLEDFSGKAECVLWSKTYHEYQEMLAEDEPVMLTGRAELSNDTIRILVNKVVPLGDSIQQLAEGYKIWIDLEKFSAASLYEMKEKLCIGNSSTKVVFYLKNNGTRSIYRADGVHIEVNDENTKSLMNIFGAGGVGFIRRQN